MQIVRDVQALREAMAGLRADGLSIALVPTMGALHAGHMALIEEGKSRAGAVVASIFVNPAQFGPNEDLEAYPRREAADARMLEAAGCRLLWAPEVSEMYPAGFAHHDQRRFGGMVARTRLFGRDLAREPIDVSPTAHFQMGGVIIDRDCRTSVEGLLVAGEDAGGTHGANRLGGNGVAESTVFGARAGDTAVGVAAARRRRAPDARQVQESIARALAPLRRSGAVLAPDTIYGELKDVMWDGCGLVRSRAGLEEAESAIDSMLERTQSIGTPGGAEWNVGWQQALDLVNQLQVARTMVTSALVREESRGAHFRDDFPERRDDEWLRYVVARLDGDEVLTDTRAVSFPRSQPPEALAV